MAGDVPFGVKMAKIIENPRFSPRAETGIFYRICQVILPTSLRLRNPRAFRVGKYEAQRNENIRRINIRQMFE